MKHEIEGVVYEVDRYTVEGERYAITMYDFTAASLQAEAMKRLNGGEYAVYGWRESEKYMIYQAA